MTGIPRVNIKNVLTQHRVRPQLKDHYVTHTTKSDVCFGVGQVTVTLLGERQDQGRDYDRRSH